MIKIALAAIMCPSFCLEEEPPALCEIEQVCDTTAFDNGAGNFPILPIPLLGINTGGGNEVFTHSPPRMPSWHDLPNIPYDPSYPTDPPIYPPPENSPTTVVPEPSSIAIMSLVGVIGLLTMRKRVCPVD